jgi:hypothetical protein
MAESRLAEIYRKELKTKGLLGALVSASGARMKEKSDIRGLLPQSGISGAAFEKMFGKKYRYGENKDSVRNAGGDSDGKVSKSMEEKLTRIGVDGRLTAKNTIVLPAMARDMNLMRMNMQKMVKISGGTPSNKSDMFFKRASDRETQYESQYKKADDMSPTSTNNEGEKGSGLGVLGFLGNLVSGLFGSILSGITNLFSGLLGPLLTNLLGLLLKGGLIVGIMALIGKYVLDDKFRESVNKIVVDLWSKVPEEFKKQLLVGGSILLGAIAGWKIAMFGLGLAMDKLRLKILGINFDGRGGRGRGGRGRGGRGRGGRGGRGGAGNRMKNLGRFGLYGMGAYGLYEGYNSIFGGNEEENGEENEEDYVPEPGQLGRGENETEAEYKKRNPQNYPVEEDGQDELENVSGPKLGLNTDTALAVGGTALGLGGLVYSANKIKKTLTPKTPTSPTPAAPAGAKPGFLMTAEDKIRARAATQAKASSRWGRFLAFVAKKSPALFARIGVKLAAMAGMAAIPIAGWISALFTLGFAVFDIYAIYTLWCEFTNTDEETANPEVNDAKTKATNVTNAPAQQDVGFVDAEGVYNTGPAPSPVTASAKKWPTTKAEIEAFQRGDIGYLKATGRMDEKTRARLIEVGYVPPAPAAPAAPGGAAKRGGSPTDTSSRRQIEAYLGRAISDAEYDALLRVTGAEAASNPMERAAVASVILNRAKKANGDIFGVLNAPYQFQAVTGPDGKSGTTDNPHSSNARKVIPGIEKQIADNIALVPRGLDSFTSAIPAAYGDVGGNAKYQKKMAEMQAHGGQKIGQSVFASMGGRPVQVASAPNTGNALNTAQGSLSEQMLAMNNAGGQTVINAPTNNTVMGGGSQNSDRSINPYNADLMKYILSQVS